MTLKFNIQRGYKVTPLQPIQIEESILNEFKEKINNTYRPFIPEINKIGGYIDIYISNDGKKIIEDRLCNCTTEILYKIHVYFRSK